MKLKRIIIAIFITGSLLGCGKDLDRYLDNPNTPRPDAANADLYLTQVELSFAGFFNEASDYGMQLTRMIHFYGPNYNNGFTPQSYDGFWTNAYTSIIKNANALIPIADQQKKYVNEGMAKIIKAYTIMTLVDIFGDVPYSEANLGVENTNPKADPGATSYAAAIALLDGAITDLSKTPASYPGTLDLFYGASNSTGAGKWRTLAKTLKLRAYMTTRLADANAATKINALLTENDLINSPSQDFEFKYSTKQANPNSRHPRYNGNYTTTGQAGDYMANYFMWILAYNPYKQSIGPSLFSNTASSDNSDPRTRYYFYRQRRNYAEVTENTAQCFGSAGDPVPPPHYLALPEGTPYCLLAPNSNNPNTPGGNHGFWGRDHGDNSGIPPDGQLRTTVGIYPAGGDFDANQGTSVSLNRGGQGAGIQPIWQTAFTNFLKAEAVLKLGSAGAARALLDAGVSASLTKVLGFPATINVTVDPTFVPSAARITDYKNKVLALYDAAASVDQKLDIVIKEWYIALWGNGIDAYNNYRRTGFPANLQPLRLASGGSASDPFIRSHLYPSVFVNRNQNATQKSNVGVRVFWDTNPPLFIK